VTISIPYGTNIWGQLESGLGFRISSRARIPKSNTSFPIFWLEYGIEDAAIKEAGIFDLISEDRQNSLYILELRR